MKIFFVLSFLLLTFCTYAKLNPENFKNKEMAGISVAYKEYLTLKEDKNMKKDEFESNEEYIQRLKKSKEVTEFMNEIYVANFDDLNLKVYKYNAEEKWWEIDIPVNFYKCYDVGINDMFISQLFLDRIVSYKINMMPSEAKENNHLFVQLLYRLSSFSDNAIYQVSGVDSIDIGNNKKHYFKYNKNGMYIKVIGVVVWDKTKEKIIDFKEF